MAITNQLTKNAYSERKQRSLIGIQNKEENENSNSHKFGKNETLGTDKNCFKNYSSAKR